MTSMDADLNTENHYSTVKKLVLRLWQFRWRIILTFIFMTLAKLSTIAIPLILKDIVDRLDLSSIEISVTLPLLLLLGYGSLRFANSLFNQLRDLVFAKALLKSIRSVSLNVFDHLQQLSLAYHLERKTGALSRDMDRGSRAISELLRTLVFSVFPTAFELTAVCAILFYRYEPKFVLVTTLTIFCYGAFTYLISNWRLRFRREMNQSESNSSSTAIDALINYETVKYFTNEKLESKRYDQRLTNWQDAAYKSEASLAVLNLGQAIIIAIGLTVLMIMAANNVVSGVMSLGDFVLINTFLLQLYVPLNFLGYVFRTLQNSLIDISRMFSLLEVKREVSNDENANELQVENANIQFKKVNFSYKQERQILTGLTLDIRGGEKIAIVGHSGSGKSTIARLLFRFYDPTDGEILIDGQDIKTVTLESLRQNIGVVPQDTVLFNDTIEFNIHYGNPAASLEEVQRAAKQAYLHEFIQSLPQGYKTQVGERGLKLSGGEKQRLAIARTLLKNPPILILDEATSALDSKSEQAIQQALLDIAKHRTTIVIAHRLSTVVDADNIIVLDNGQISESGTHQQLIEQHGQYADLWHRQLSTNHKLSS